MKINSKELQQIIKEEALRLKRKMMLEAEKSTILKKLQEVDECGMMEEAPVTSGEVQIKPEVEAVIEKRASAISSKISPEQAQKATQELEAAGLLGASEDEIKARVAQIFPTNESVINEIWDKSKIYNMLVGAGLGTTLVGLVTTALGALPTEELSKLADYTDATVTPGTGVILGLVALAIGAISTIVGMKGNQKMADASQKKMSPEQAARIIAARKAGKLRR